MFRRSFIVAWCLVAVALVAVVGGAIVARPEPSGRVDAGRFTSTVDNPFFPLRPGSRWVYGMVGPDGQATRVVVQATTETRQVGGVACVAVRDTVTAGQQVVVDTLGWYAQDADGNVWLFGEETRQFTGGRVVGTAGSWRAGVNRAEPGLVMKAAPRLGDSYRQPYGGRAADTRHTAHVVSLDQNVSVAFGFFTGVLVIESATPLRPGVVEHRFYARGVGLILAITVVGGPGHAKLVEMTATAGHPPGRGFRGWPPGRGFRGWPS